ncbi:MAG: arginase, partial [Bryobacteraceae bacterium]
RLAGLDARIATLGYNVEDLGNVFVEQQESTPSGPSNAKYLAQISLACASLANVVDTALREEKFPLVLGGDHSVAAGTVAGVANAYRQRHQSVGLIWIDAHADMNTPDSSPSGNVHGMPLACCIGQGPSELTEILGFAPKVQPRNVVLIGIRDVDVAERRRVRESGIAAFTMRDIDECGLRQVMEQALALAGDGTAGIHLSLDMDAIDPDEAPGVGTPVRGGITYREAHLAMEIICDSSRLCSMEIVEVNPVLDSANRTALLGVELVLSALGKRIL